MARVTFTANLQRYLNCTTAEAASGSVRAVLDQVFAGNPRLRSYILDDQGRVRRHVTIYVNDTQIADRDHLSDRVGASDEVFVFQALTGG
ncbi:MAG TPA: MoaD/ThiS family protein [Methylomirabilota bacterium]|nr:MoaD/ThiS family protein [Methylomirabilota bacterium]